MSKKYQKKIKKNRARSNKAKKRSGGNRADSLQNLLQKALALHQAGQLPKAETIYRKILLVRPNHPEALNYLGWLAHQVGKSEIATELINKALSSRPDYAAAHNNLGAILNHQGRLNEAAASFSRALSLEPDDFVAHYNLGNTLKDLGRPDEAVVSYRKALSLKPNYVDALINLGSVLSNQRRLDEAAASYRRALSLKPDYAEAHNNLGSVFLNLGLLDEAATSFRRALSLKPDYAEAHNNLGEVFIRLGMLDEASASFRKALSLKPEDAYMHQNLGRLYTRLGKVNDAVESIRRALCLKPGFVNAYRNLSEIVKFNGINDDVHAMEELYNKKDIPKEDRALLGFALGKAYEDMKDYDKSISYILTANKLKRKSYKYSIRSDSDFFARIKKVFSDDFFASNYDSGHKHNSPIFILGMPRSGTTLIEQILASHRLVFAAGELYILQHLINEVCTRKTGHFPECLKNVDMDTFKKIGSVYIEKNRVYSKSAQHITDKMPSNFLYIGLIKAILPNAKIIHCTRNPMDTCFSIFKHDFNTTHSYAYDLVELGAYYNLYQDLMTHWEKVLPGFIYTIRYEEMVFDFKKQTRNLLGFCQLPWDEACLAFHKTERIVSTASLAQVRKPIYKDSVELWKKYEKHLEPLKKAIYG